MVVPPDAIEEIPHQIRRLRNSSPSFRERMRRLRDSWVYNVGSSGAVAADYIAGKAEELRRARR